MKPSRRALAAATTVLLAAAPLTLTTAAEADTPRPTTLTLGPTGDIAPGESFSLEFDLNGPNLDLRGESVHVTRIDAAHPNGEALPDIADRYFNTFILQGTAPTSGPLSYRIDYSGDANYQASTATFAIPVAKYAPTLQLSAPATAPRSGTIAISGKLSWANRTDHLTTGQVHAVRFDAAHPHGIAVGAVPVAADGTFTLHDAPTIGGVNTYAFTYDGGSAYLPVTQTATVQVSRQATTLAVSTSGAVFNYGGWVHVTAHLGTTYNGRRVTLYAQPAGGARTAFNSGTVDAHGNLSSWYKLTHNTVFSAAFGGDYRYAPTTAVSRIAYVHAQVTDSMLQVVDSAHIGGTLYAVYLRDTHLQPMLDTLVAPDHTGQPIIVVLQRYYGGAWHTVTTKTTALKSYSTIYTDLPWATMSNYALYRVAAEYVHNAADTTNLDAWGNWAHFTVRPHP